MTGSPLSCQRLIIGKQHPTLGGPDYGRPWPSCCSLFGECNADSLPEDPPETLPPSPNPPPPPIDPSPPPPFPGSDRFPDACAGYVADGLCEPDNQWASWMTWYAPRYPRPLLLVPQRRSLSLSHSSGTAIPAASFESPRRLHRHFHRRRRHSRCCLPAPCTSSAPTVLASSPSSPSKSAERLREASSLRTVWRQRMVRLSACCIALRFSA